MIQKTNPFKIFYKGSKTFFTASLFFPKDIKQDVFDLYAFVRVADDYVDSVPQQAKEFYKFKEDYYQSLKVGYSKNAVIEKFIKLQKKLNFEQSWVDAFFFSMEQDLTKAEYTNSEETLKYIYGSAEVIGLMMAKIMNLPEKSYEYASKLGRAFQFMNMIRDIKEDLSFNRCYFPKEEYSKLGFVNLTQQVAEQNPEAFKKFVFEQIKRYWEWREEAGQGFGLIPKRYRIPIVAASESFDKTIHAIESDPMLVWKGKQGIPVSRLDIVWSIIKQLFK